MTPQKKYSICSCIKQLILYLRKRHRSLLGIIILLIIWQVASFYFQKTIPSRADTILPSISYVINTSLPGFASYAKGAQSHTQSSFLIAFSVLGYHSLITSLRVISGTILGMIVGILLGLLIEWSTLLRRYLLPIISTIRPIPLLALIPLFLLWFGGSEIGNLLYIVFGISVMVVVNTLNAIRNISPYRALYAETLGANRFQVYKDVILPSIIPELMGGIKVALGIAWTVTLGAELLATQTGLGRLMMLSQYFMYTGRMILIVILFMIFTSIMNSFASFIGKKLTNWQP